MRLLFLSLTLILSCAGPEPKTDEFDAKFNQLQAGMTPAQTKALLGEPSLRELKNNIETWTYSQSGGRSIEFNNSKLVGFGRIANASPAGSPKPLLMNKAIGEICDDNNECQSKNCHFHKCSGKSNCSASIGKLCAQDSDCCQGRCNMGYCRK